MNFTDNGKLKAMLEFYTLEYKYKRANVYLRMLRACFKIFRNYLHVFKIFAFLDKYTRLYENLF